MFRSETLYPLVQKTVSFTPKTLYLLDENIVSFKPKDSIFLTDFVKFPNRFVKRSNRFIIWNMAWISLNVRSSHKKNRLSAVFLLFISD